MFGDRPTGVLFVTQIKSFLEENVKPKYIQVDELYNGLCNYEIKNNFLEIDEKTLHYWEGFGIPVYLFVVIESCSIQENGKLDCYYKRYTPILTKENFELKEESFYSDFYKVNEDDSFIAFKDKENRTQGFTRDLFIDHVRCCYYKGLLTYLDPKAIGLNQFVPNAVFEDMFESYEQKIRSAHKKTEQYLKQLDELRSKKT